MAVKYISWKMYFLSLWCPTAMKSERAPSDCHMRRTRGLAFSRKAISSAGEGARQTLPLLAPWPLPDPPQIPEPRGSERCSST